MHMIKALSGASWRVVSPITHWTAPPENLSHAEGQRDFWGGFVHLFVFLIFNLGDLKPKGRHGATALLCTSLHGWVWNLPLLGACVSFPMELSIPLLFSHEFLVFSSSLPTISYSVTKAIKPLSTVSCVLPRFAVCQWVFFQIFWNSLSRVSVKLF